MLEGRDRESLLNGLYAVVQEGRRNINGSKADIAFTSTYALNYEQLFAFSICLDFLARASASAG